MQALKQFPKARAAVAAALEQYESPDIPAIEGELIGVARL
jgi:hypothetical protein